ncbi:MAG: alkylation response protein AidB-like acyl-CoA dehydrogenase [Shewanella sp.]|jgi:alkylation response protein AidB-like acyl-CoA dehydrogenase
MFYQTQHQTEIQQMLADSASRFLKDNYDFHEHYQRLKKRTPVRDDIWQTFADLGWLAVPYAEEFGGFDGKCSDLTPLLTLFGEHLVLEPFVSQCLSGQLIEQLGSEWQKTHYIPALIDAKYRMSLAYYEASHRYQLSSLDSISSLNTDGSINLKAQKVYVQDTQQLTHLLILSADVKNGQWRWVIVPTDHSGVKLEHYPGTDDRPMASVNISITGLSAEHILDKGHTQVVTQKMFNTAIAYNCADSLGCINKLMHLTATYLNDRKQFGQTLAQFQALQHKLANMFIQQQRAISMLTMLAEQLLEVSDEQQHYISSLASLQVHAAAKFIAETAIQLHGGIGTTEELNIGHYAKRLLANACRYGDSHYHQLRCCKQLRTKSKIS